MSAAGGSCDGTCGPQRHRQQPCLVSGGSASTPEGNTWPAMQALLLWATPFSLFTKKAVSHSGLLLLLTACHCKKGSRQLGSILFIKQQSNRKQMQLSNSAASLFWSLSHVLLCPSQLQSKWPRHVAYNRVLMLVSHAPKGRRDSTDY